jgi:hypothetical protein
MTPTMEELDYFYRAYHAYRANLEPSKADLSFRKANKGVQSPDDFITMVTTTVTIDEDWIVAIEKGLIYIGKAIKEDRQFIRNEGEILPIEKIRRVDKDSVANLAKHSDYITKRPTSPNDNVIPEKLLMVRRENDYSIYENRVVYATLVYLKDFIVSRLNRINEAISRYEGHCQIRKKIVYAGRTLDFSLHLDDVRKDDPIAAKRNSCQGLIDRINEILNDVVLLLRTRLMQEVAKAPLVSRPITKTNVLRMNVNFKGSLAAFDYACAYPSDGFRIEETEKKICPLPEEEALRYADIIALDSFLTYQLNNALLPDLEKSYRAEEKRRKEEDDAAMLSRLEELMERVKKSGKSTPEYILALEEGLGVLKQQVETAKGDLSALKAESEAQLQAEKQVHALVLEEEKRHHQQVVDSILADHEKEMAEAESTHQKEKAEMEATHQQEVAALKAAAEKDKAELSANYEQQIADLNKTLQVTKECGDNLAEQLSAALSAKAESEAAGEAKVKAAEQERDAVKQKAAQEVQAITAENAALRIACGKSPKPAELSSRERFLELEEEKKNLDVLFEAAWKEAKKDIRHRLFAKNPEDQGGKKK